MVPSQAKPQARSGGFRSTPFEAARQARAAKREPSCDRMNTPDSTKELLAVQEQLKAAGRERNGPVAFAKARNALLDRRRELVMGVPHFWLRVLRNHPAFGGLLTEEDCARLQSLVDVEIVKMKMQTGEFSVEFTFADNDFFGDRVVSKSYTYSDAGGIEVSTSALAWKPGMEPQGLYSGRGSGFFHWLCMDAHDDRRLAEILRDDIYANAIDLYMGSFVAAPDPLDAFDDVL